MACTSRIEVSNSAYVSTIGLGNMGTEGLLNPEIAGIWKENPTEDIWAYKRKSDVEDKN